MIRPMFGYRPKPKKFELPFRYYDPEKDQREKRRRRIRIETNSHRRPAQNARVLFFALLLALVWYIIAY
ncbi:MAG: hypothetical protein AAFW89_03795 [Bacteroidota bacterium]